MAVIETARLPLRAGSADDVELIVTALNDWSVAQWLIRPPFPYTNADAAAFIAWTQKDHEKAAAGIFIIADRVTDELIGCICAALQQALFSGAARKHDKTRAS